VSAVPLLRRHGRQARHLSNVALKPFEASRLSPHNIHYADAAAPVAAVIALRHGGTDITRVHYATLESPIESKRKPYPYPDTGKAINRDQRRFKIDFQFSKQHVLLRERKRISHCIDFDAIEKK